MQLQLTRDELKLLADVLNSSEHRAASGLLDQVLVRDLRFGFDELEDMAEILKLRSQVLSEEITRAQTPDLKRDLQQTRAMLEHVVDKVTEACAMA